MGSPILFEPRKGPMGLPGLVRSNGAYCIVSERIVALQETKQLEHSVSMANQGTSSSTMLEIHVEEEDGAMMFGAESGWVEARTSCDHLGSLSSDLVHIPTPDTPCNRCQHPSENWLCLCCKDVLCSRFVNKHMLQHYHQTNHSVALSYSDLSVWCFICDAYLDAQVISQLRPVYETAYILKFGEAPPVRTVQQTNVKDNQAEGTSFSG